MNPVAGMLVLLILLCSLFVDGPGLAADHLDVPAIVAANGAALEAIGSEDDARRVFDARLKPALGLIDPHPATGRATPSAASESDGISLTAELVAWRIATLLRGSVDEGDHGALAALLRAQERTLAWLLAEHRRRSLSNAVTWARILAGLPETPTGPMPPGYERFAAAADRTLPTLERGDRAWLPLAEQEGADGVMRRLTHVAEEGGAGPNDRSALAARYLADRLAPVFRAESLAWGIRAEAEAERAAQQEWDRVRSAEEERRLQRGQARLCGTWQWTIHNHKNHQEHKVMMVFPPPDPATRSDPRLSQMIVHGDTVYLRWEFPGGLQEESLLFGSEGQRLEGTFVNSTGAWGSITGKRATACSREAR